MKLDSAVFYTNDIEKTKEFYQNFLGLKLDYVTPDKFVQFSFENGVKLGIKKVREEREKPGTGTIFVSIDSVGELYEEYKQKEVMFYKELTVQDWGTEFSILDPDGNKVLFLQR